MNPQQKKFLLVAGTAIAVVYIAPTFINSAWRAQRAPGRKYRHPTARFHSGTRSSCSGERVRFESPQKARPLT